MTSPLPPSVTNEPAVTNADILRVLTDIKVQLATAVTQLQDIKTKGDDHENRIRVLENSYRTARGIAISLGTIAGVLSGILTNHVKF